MAGVAAAGDHGQPTEVELPTVHRVRRRTGGAYIVSKVLADPAVVSAQLRHHRTYLELLFAEDG